MLLSAMGTIKDIFHIVILSVLDIALHIVHSLGKHDITTFDYNLKTRTTFLLQVFLFVSSEGALYVILPYDYQAAAAPTF